MPAVLKPETTTFKLEQLESLGVVDRINAGEQRSAKH